MDGREPYGKQEKEESGLYDPLVYTSQALQHFRNPRNVGQVENANGKGSFGDTACGDYIEVTIRVDEKEERLQEVKFLIRGCAGAIATSSVMTELARGKTIPEALALTDGDIIRELGGLPKRKQHCSLLGLQALQQAIADYLFRSLMFRKGVVKTEEEYEKLRGQYSFLLQPHACDGSCEE
ncbi:MAG: iron-sulfur cluster assembly scaffold protein, partial [Deltaproteobacteria bacterium]|nr:iron-sulfur cluster assembly scaffold protein [Deltaproteobacteria bacterium]